MDADEWRRIICSNNFDNKNVDLRKPNCYETPARLFVIDDTEVRSNEGTTQGDPIEMQ